MTADPCLNCGKPIARTRNDKPGAVNYKRFCSDACKSRYSYHQRNPTATFYGQEDAPKREPKPRNCPVPRKHYRRKNVKPEYVKIGGTEAQRINNVVAKAEAAGTCYNMAQLAPADAARQA